MPIVSNGSRHPSVIADTDMHLPNVEKSSVNLRLNLDMIAFETQ